MTTPAERAYAIAHKDYDMTNTGANTNPGTNSGFTEEDYKKMLELIGDKMSPMPSMFSDIFKYQPPEIKLPEPDNNFRFMRNWGLGLPVYKSEHAYKTVTKVVGISDSRRPNSKKPLYRRVTVREPVAYLVNGVGLIASSGFITSLSGV